MYHSRPSTTRPNSGGDGPPKLEPLYAPDELELLRDELLDAYTLPREKMITRDEANDLRRTDVAIKETQRMTKKKEKEEDLMIQLKAKQDALRRLYENVLTEKKVDKNRKHKKKRRSEGSFHEMYTVYHDPIRGSQIVKDVESPTEDAVKLLGSTPLTPAGGHAKKSSGAGAAQQGIREGSVEIGVGTATEFQKGKQLSKFGLQPRLASKSKPPPLLSGEKSYDPKMSLKTEVQYRKDARYSEDHGRYSFDVDVHGPFLTYTDSTRIQPEIRHVGTQVMMMDNLIPEHQMDEGWSQTEMEMTHWDPNRFSFASDSTGFGGVEDVGDEEQAAGDASSSNPSSEKGDTGGEEEEEDEDEGKQLEKKESKRRDAETTARPRGYKDLDLNLHMSFVTFEAETSVTAYDLEREIAKQRGFTLARDNVLWPTCEEFDMDTASKRIEDYIKRCWTLDPKWLFFIQPLEVYHDNYRKKYVFEVKFSVPTPTTPVPLATASVFFVFEHSLYAGKEETVKVTYVLEGTRFAHKPGRVPFQDKWLWGILSDKMRIQKAVNF